MKISTRVVIDIETGRLLSRDWYEYDGQLALCDRGQSKAVANQGMQQSATDQANAQTALANTNSAVQQQQQATRNFLNFGRKTYGPQGSFMRDQNTLATTAAGAGSKALGGDLALHAMRTGENTSGYATAAGEDRRQRQRDVTTQMATADASRLANLSNVQQIGLDASKFPAQTYGSLYGPSVSGSTGQLDPAARAAAQPSGWDVFGKDLAAGVGAAAGAYAGCWVAAEIFGGWMEPRTVLVREWLNTEFNKSILGDMVLRLYVRFGESVAAGVRRSRLLRAALTPLFEAALRRARAVKTAQKNNAANSASVPKASPER